MLPLWNPACEPVSLLSGDETCRLYGCTAAAARGVVPAGRGLTVVGAGKMQSNVMNEMKQQVYTCLIYKICGKLWGEPHAGGHLTGA
jgi:hypothetical protein